MTVEQIQQIISERRFPGRKQPAALRETHISWLIMTPEFVFKIKKPVKYSFLDFSTLERRAFYCREELHLNRRLAPDMYLDVLPVSLANDGKPEIGGENTPIDMALRMKRMDDSRQMDRLLEVNEVSASDMESLAKILAQFHRKVIIPGEEAPYEAGDNRSDFDDLFQLEQECIQLFGAGASESLADWRKSVDAFLARHEARLHARARSGFWVEGHGDLHSRNIFLLPEAPVVFDCIEFNPHFRKVDVLNDLAFLCMDLDAQGHPELAETFMEKYQAYWSCMPEPEDRAL